MKGQRGELKFHAEFGKHGLPHGMLNCFRFDKYTPVIG